MFLKSLKLRLTTLFSIVFLVGSAALYVASYLLLSSSLQQEEIQLLRSKMLEFWATYQTGRIIAVQRELNRYVTESNAFFVRISNQRNETIFFVRPNTWAEVSAATFELEPPNTDRIVDVHLENEAFTLRVMAAKVSERDYLQIGVSNRRRIDLLRNLRRTYLSVAVPILVLGFVGGWAVSSRSMIPVKKLSKLTKSIIDTGELSQRIPPTGTGDELDELTKLFNRMLERIETLVDGMRSSLDNVAHDLRTPMTRLRMKAEEAISGGESGSADRALTSIVSESEQILTMLKTLMDITEAETGVMKLDREHVDLRDIVVDLAELYGYTAADKEISIETDVASGLTSSVDTNRIRQVMANLLDNAVKYTDPGGRVTVRGTREDTRVRLDFTDTGIGIDEADLNHIWERLYRGDRSRTEPGLGLGLGLVKAIVEAHDGEVAVTSAVNRGSTFSILLPASSV